jgi:lipopolysaccharide export system protein LptA
MRSADAFLLAIMLALASPAAFAAGKAASTSFLPGGNSKDPVTINAGKLDYFDKEKKLIYSGVVNAAQGESKVKCTIMVIFLTKEAEGDAANAKSDGPAGGNTSMDRVECTGPVTIVSKGDVGTGDNGVYDKRVNEFVLTGHVALSQGPNVTTGDKLVYDMTTAQAHVSGNVNSLFVPGSSPDVAKPKKPGAK